MLYFAILSIHRQVWFALNVYCFTNMTQIMFCLSLSHIVMYGDMDIVYCAVCIAMHQCIVPALHACMMLMQRSATWTEQEPG